MQSRREIFLTILQNICADKKYLYEQLTGTNKINDANWVEFRFVPKKDGENLPDYEFHKFVDELVRELDSVEFFVTWYEHPGRIQAVKVEIDES